MLTLTHYPITAAEETSLFLVRRPKQSFCREARSQSVIRVAQCPQHDVADVYVASSYETHTTVVFFKDKFGEIVYS